MEIIGKFVPKEANTNTEFEVTSQWAVCKVGEDVSEYVGNKANGMEYHVYTDYWNWVEY